MPVIEPQTSAPPGAWPVLPAGEWSDTLETLHLWTQIVGKVRMELSPWINHSWAVPLYVTARGLGTSLVHHGARAFEIDFDFVGHRAHVEVSDGATRSLTLEPRSVADFYRELLETLRSLGLDVAIHPVPNELEDVTPFPDDRQHASYDPRHAKALWQALVQADRVMKVFRAGFIGKASPVHFFWGSFDLAVTRFSGREAPEHPGGFPNMPDEVAREAYSHEVTSSGFWPGNRETPTPIFYAYAYPTPEGFSESEVQPDAAFWLEAMGEFALPYEAVRRAPDPDSVLLSFFESAHAAAADLAGWNRGALERERGWRPVGRYVP